MTVREGEKETREQKGQRKKDGHGGRTHKQRGRRRKNEINREREKKTRGAERRCDKASKMKVERKTNTQRKKEKRVTEKGMGEKKMVDLGKEV